MKTTLLFAAPRKYRMSNMCTVTKAALQRKKTHRGKQDAVNRRETEVVNIFTHRTTERREKRPKKKTIAAAQILMLHYRGASLTMLTLNSQFR